MKILVTGGAGFIGSHTIVELFNAGFEPVIVDDFRNSERTVLEGLKKILGFPVTCYKMDCSNVGDLKTIIAHENIEGVIHFAASKSVGESTEFPLNYYKNNVGSTIAVLEAILATGITNFVFSSSCTVYGEPDIIPVTEKTARKQATSPYGNTKVICEDIIRDTVASKARLRAISLRYFNPVGAHHTGLIGELPRGIPSNLVPFITQTAAGIRKKLTVFGDDYNTADGTNVRDFIHVVDLAKAHVSALQFLIGQNSENLYEVFNIGTGKGNSVLELISTFEATNQVKVNYVIGARREGDIEKIYGNVEKAKNILKWKAEKSLAESLRDAWRWEARLNSHPSELIL